MANAALIPALQFFGTDYAGYKIYSYEPSTTTAKALYQSSSGSSGSAHTNPITLNSNGTTTTGIWGTGFYRIIMKTPTGTTVFDWDNVSGADAATGTSSATGTSALDPSNNLLRNTSFTAWASDTTTLTGRSDGTETAKFWYGLTQSGNFDATLITNAASTLTNYALKITNTHASTQRIGVLSVSPISVSEARVGQIISQSVKVLTDVGQTIRIALCAAISTSSPTVDIVNTWTSPTLTEGNFFISSANLEIISTSSVTTTAGTWATASVSGTAPNNSTGYYMFIWTDAAIGVNSYLQIAQPVQYEGNSTLDWRPADANLDRSVAKVDVDIITPQLPPITDSTAIVKNASDATKKLAISAAGITTATTRTWTAPDYNVNFVHGAFHAYDSASATSVPNNSATKLTLDAEDFDTSGWFDNSTNFRYTPQVAGYYFFSAGVKFNSLDGNGVVRIMIYKNGSSIATNNSRNPSSNLEVSSTVSTVVYMNGTTDYIEAWAFQDAGATDSVNTGRDQTFLCGFHIPSA